MSTPKEILKVLRELKGVSRYRMCKDLNMSYQAILYLEDRKYTAWGPIITKNKRKIAKYFGVNPRDIWARPKKYKLEKLNKLKEQKKKYENDT